MENKNVKRGFLLYFDSYPALMELEAEQRGLLLSALYVYADRVWRDETVTLEEILERRVQQAIRAALDLFQGLEADCLRLGGRAALAAPWRKEALEKQWAAAFPALEINLEVEGRLARG